MIGAYSVGANAVCGEITYDYGAFTLLVSGIDRTGMYNLNSLRLRKSLGSQAKLDIILKDSGQTFSPQVGEPIELYKDAEFIFGGSIESVRIDADYDHNMALNVVKLTCVDHERLSTRYLIAKNYETANQTLRDIFSDILTIQTPMESEDGIKLRMIEDTVLVSDFVIDYRSVKKTFDDLTRQTGHCWFVTPWKHLAVEALGQTSAPQEITDTNPIYRDMQVRKSRSKYRNRQYLRAGSQKTVSQTDNFLGDGETQTFTLRHPVNNDPDVSKPTFSINSTPVLESVVGVKGADDDDAFEWYYSVGDNTVSQRSSDTPLSSSQTLSVDYVGEIPTIILEELEDEKTNRRTVEGGSGLYEHVEEDTDLVDRDFSVQRAEGFLARFGRVAEVFEFSTRETGFEPGQLLTVNVSVLGSSREYLIQDVDLSDSGGRGKEGNLWYKVRASSPPFEFESWVEYFTRLYNRRPLQVSRSNEKLLIVRKKEEQVDVSETFSETSGASVESNILDPDTNDPYTAAVIGEIDSLPSMVIGYAIIGEHAYQK